MTMHTKASNAWKTVRYVYAKVSGSWQNVGQIYCKSGGTWYPVWSYSWTTGSYGSCSASCGGGTQTRSVTCTRNDGYTMDDAYCTKYVGTKPATSQSCNTQACEECYTSSGYIWVFECSTAECGGGGSAHVLWNGKSVGYVNRSYCTPLSSGCSLDSSANDVTLTVDGYKYYVNGTVTGDGGWHRCNENEAGYGYECSYSAYACRTAV